MNIQTFLLKKVAHALRSIKIESTLKLIQIQKSNKIKFGDYQINGLITISKKLNIPIEKLTTKLIKFLDIYDLTQTIKIEQPGFINIFLKPKWIENQINHIFYSSRLGIPLVTKKKTIIIDYSSPNIAKEMHVGHLRSTIIGDSVAHILSFLGHNVIRANHIGDWGTQFGMLIAYIENTKQDKFLHDKNIKFSTLEHFYQEAKKKYNTNQNFAELSRNCILKLQKGNIYYRKIWKKLVNISISNNQKIYHRLNISLSKKDIMGESLYNDMLPDVIADLKNKGIAVQNKGAIVVFTKNSHTKQNNPFGVVIQKKDGAYLYSTTDIACIKYRCEKLHADKIIYYTDSRQKQHLAQVYEIANRAGYTNRPKNQSVSLEHHACGMLLNKNGKPFKTRHGNVLKVNTLLDEALNRTYHLIHSKNSKLQHNQINKISHNISIGAIKYSELSKNRTIDYKFNWGNILNFEGNTSPYIQYAYTRIYSVIKRFYSDQFYCILKNKNIITLKTKEEITLAKCLLQFEETIDTVANQGSPHILCAYLYKLSVLFSFLYEYCPILKVKDTNTMNSRLKLVFITARIIKKGLKLLGIKTVKYM